MRIVFDLDIDDMMAFQENFLTHYKQFKYIRLFVVLLLPAALLFMFLIFHAKEGGMTGKLTGFGIFFMVLSGLWIVVMWKQFLKMSLKNTRKMILKNAKNNPIVLGEREMVFDEKGISVKTSKSETWTDWSAIFKVEKNVDYYYLYVTNMNAFVVPIRKIGYRPEELDAVLEKHVANIIGVE
ncbi:MAG: YcxB family protein [Candidatus Azobacteroides sp.]|nr:YcxB family protein [Candidatus Azobacteroides sp.]